MNDGFCALTDGIIWRCRKPLRSGKGDLQEQKLTGSSLHDRREQETSQIPLGCELILCPAD